MNNASESFLRGSAMPKETVDEGVTRQILGFDDSIMMVRVEFDEGGVGYVHSHPHSQVTYVESGEFEVTIDGEARLLAAGDAFRVPNDVDHGAVCRKSGVLIDVFSPVREDFLKEGE